MFHVNIWLFFTVVKLIFVLEVNSTKFNISDFNDNSKLVFVHVLFRHGDRNALRPSPGDPYDISYWPEGWAELTSLGKQQHYALGKWLRGRYANFLNATYNANDVYVQSSDVDRTLMSALSNLAGLYPPKKDTAWNPSLLWQPIPVHTSTYQHDYLLASTVPRTCWSYYKALTAYNLSPKGLDVLKEAKPYFDYLTNKTGTTIKKFVTLTLIRDSWLVESDRNLPIPKWAQQLLRKDKGFYNAALYPYQAYSATPHLAKFSAGFLLKDILDRFTSKAEKTLTPDRKFWIYSSHDSVIVRFLEGLGMFDNKFPEYAAALMFELRLYKNEYYVQIIYKSPNPKTLEIPGCGAACPLSKLKEIYANILPKKSFRAECRKSE